MIKKFNVEKTRHLDKINAILSLLYRKSVCDKECALSAVENILIVDFALIGDMIMNIPFLKTIRYNCPRAQITMVCMPWAKTVLGDQGLVDEFVIFDGKNNLSSLKSILKSSKEIKNVLYRINQKEYQIGIEPKGDLRHILFLHYTNCDRTITYNYTGGEFLVTDSFSPRPETKHLIDEKLDLLEMSGFQIHAEDRIPRLILSEESKSVVKAFLEENDIFNKYIIGVHPGASNINKQYHHYPELIKKISNGLADNIVFAVFEGPGESEIVKAVILELDKTNVKYVVIKRTLKEYVALVSICDYMICNDSAAGHIATAYGIPTFVIFGAVKAETSLPRGASSVKYISHDLDCKPCTLPVCPLGTEECMAKITTDEVMNVLSNDFEEFITKQ